MSVETELAHARNVARRHRVLLYSLARSAQRILRHGSITRTPVDLVRLFESDICRAIGFFPECNACDGRGCDECHQHGFVWRE